MRKNYKFITTLLSASLIVGLSSDVSKQKNELDSSDLYNENRVKEIYAEENNIEYINNDTLETTEYGNMKSVIEKKEKSTKTTVSLDGDTDINLKKKCKKSKESFSSEITYNEEDYIDSLETNNQSIKFDGANGVLNSVTYNNEIIYKSSSFEHGFEKKYANGGCIKNYYSDYNVYEFENDEKIVIMSQDDSVITQYANGDVVTTTYDEAGEINKIKNKFLEYRLMDTFYLLNYGSKSYFISYEDIDKERTIIINGEPILSYSADNSIFMEKDKVVRNVVLDNQKKITNETFFDNTYSYQYNQLGYITDIQSNGSHKQYEYDSLGRLIYSNIDGTNYYSYDINGNILSANENYYIYDNNKLISYNNNKVNYDGAGNILSFDDFSYHWKAGKLLDSVWHNNMKIASYIYDENGLRLQKKTTTGQKDYFYVNNTLYSTNNNGKITTYLYFDDTPFGFIYDDNIYFYEYNQLGIIECIYDGNAERVVQYFYDDWGKIESVIDISENNSVSEANDLLYKGYVYDEESGLYYLTTRYYNPILKRFISMDSFEKVYRIGSNDYTYNLYSYCANNPLMFSDNSGFDLALDLALIGTLYIIGVIIVCLLTYYLTRVIVESITAGNLGIAIKHGIEDLANDLAAFFKEVKRLVEIAIGSYLITLFCRSMNPDKIEVHHIVAENDIRAFARPIMINYYGSTNIENNKVSLKYRFHKHLHTFAYHFAVNTTLYDANKLGGKTLFDATLLSIKVILEQINIAYFC